MFFLYLLSDSCSNTSKNPLEISSKIPERTLGELPKETTGENSEKHTGKPLLASQMELFDEVLGGIPDF